MGRAPCCENNGLKKGPWTAEEDQKLIDYIQKHGHGSWRMLPKNAGLSRCGKSCRLRWTNYLRPDIKRGRFSFEEEETIIQLHSILGNKWSAIAARLPGRTDNEIKNYWNTHIRKRLLRMGIDPVTHSPRLDLLDLSTLLTNPSLYNQTQLDMSRLVNFEPLVNSELLRFASTILSSQNQGLQQEPQFTNNSTQVQNQGLQQEPQFTNNSTQVRDSLQQFQNPIQQVPTCTTSEPEFFNVGQFQINADQWQNNNMHSNFSENFTATMGYDNLEQLVPHFVSDNSNFYLQNNQNYAMNNNSGISTPVSSPTQLNSASTYINSSTEDERESYCSELFKFEIPELLDVSEFM